MSNVAVASDSLQMSQQARSHLAAEGVAGRFRESKGRNESVRDGYGTGVQPWEVGVTASSAMTEQTRYIGRLH